MSTNQIPNLGFVANNVTSDGQGHYVVYHEPSQPVASPVQVSQQYVPAAAPSFATPTMQQTTNVSTVSGVSTPRPRILTRPSGTLPTVSAVFTPSSSSGMVRLRNSNIPKVSAIVPTSGQQMKQSNIHFPQVVTFMDGEENGNFSGMTQLPTALTIYPDNRQSPNEAILNAGTGSISYTTLPSVENYQMNMNNVYVETLPTNNMDPSTVLMTSDNQLYNIQNNGETMLFCSSSVNEDHGSLNLMPIMDTSEASMGQIHFPIGDVGNRVYELITLPSDSSITSFTDQPILSLSNGTNFGTVIPMVQQDPSTQFVYNVHNGNGVGIPTVTSIGGVLQSIPPLTVVESNPAPLFSSAPSTTITTMAPSESSGTLGSEPRKSQRTYITVVDDFSDLIKTDLPERSWGSIPDFDQQQGLSFGNENSDDDSIEEGSSRNSSNSDREGQDSQDSPRRILGTGIENEKSEMEISMDLNTPGGTTFTDMSISDVVYENIQSTFEGDSEIMVMDDYLEEVGPTLGEISETPNMELDAVNEIPIVTTLESIITTGKGKPPSTRKPEIKRKPVPITPKNLSHLSRDQGQLSFNDFTSITLRNTMEKEEAEAKLPPRTVVEKPQKPKTPPVALHIRHGLASPIPLVEWVDGIGTFPGLCGKIRVQDSTGELDLIDFNPADHRRRIPLKIVKEQNNTSRKKGYPKPKVFFKSTKTTVNMVKTDSGLPIKSMKVRAKVVVPPSSKSCIEQTINSTSASSTQLKVEESTEVSDKDQMVDVTFCITCGTLANRDKELTGRNCRNCFETQREEPAEEESPNTRFKIPKGITIVKTSKSVESPPTTQALKPRRLLKPKPEPNPDQPSSCDAIFAKKSNPLPIFKIDPLPTGDSIGITVIPILQTNSPAIGPNAAPKSSSAQNSKEVPLSKSKRRKHRRTLIEQKKMKSKAVGKDPSRKRSFEKILNTKSSYVTKGLLGSGSSISDARSPGPEETSESDEPSRLANSKPPAEPKKSLVAADFNWTKYLQETNSKGAPPRFFRQPAFPGSNPFKIGMMLEAVDPQHQSLFCVVNVVDIQGYRLRLHLTGYSEIFDFWVNADSYDIFPPGWCEENNYKLEPPPTVENFNWHKYLIDEQLVPAEREFFTISKDPVTNPTDIQVGMKLEAVDIRNMSLTCVATVQNIINDRLLIHFDSWDCIYDYWTDTSSPFIHPVGYCKKNGIELTPPKGYKGAFLWENYLKETGSVAVPSQFIRPLPPIGFKKTMKLECVDKRNPFLIRVATVADVLDHQILIHFDGWSSDYDFKVYECSGEIHPTGWCAATGHPLQLPPDSSTPWSGACSIFGCLGLGHIKGYKFMTHNAEINCPYSTANLKKDWGDLLPDRFVSYKKSVIVTQQHENSSSSRRNSDSVEAQTTFAKAAKLRSEKRKSLAATENPVVPAKRKYTKRKSEAETLMKAKVTSSSETEDSKDRSRRDSLLHKRLLGRPPKTSMSSFTCEQTSKVPPVSVFVIDDPPELAKRILYPNIESTITPVLPPSALPDDPAVKVHWEEVIDSVIKDTLKKGVQAGTSGTITPPEFTLPSSTTMTPIPTPGTCTSTTVTSTDTYNPKSPADHLLMICSQKAGGELTISQCSNDSSNGESGTNGSSSKNVPIESDTDLPINYSHNIKMLQGIVGNLNQATVSKWRTKNVVAFVRKIPGCLAASASFDEHKIDGEAFLLMTMTDFSEVMELKMGPCIKLSYAIRLVHKNSLVNPLPAVSITPIPASAL